MNAENAGGGGRGGNANELTAGNLAQHGVAVRKGAGMNARLRHSSRGRRVRGARPAKRFHVSPPRGDRDREGIKMHSTTATARVDRLHLLFPLHDEARCGVRNQEEGGAEVRRGRDGCEAPDSACGGRSAAPARRAAGGRKRGSAEKNESFGPRRCRASQCSVDFPPRARKAIPRRERENAGEKGTSGGGEEWWGDGSAQRRGETGPDRAGDDPRAARASSRKRHRATARPHAQSRRKARGASLPAADDARGGKGGQRQRQRGGGAEAERGRATSARVSRAREPSAGTSKRRVGPQMRRLGEEVGGKTSRRRRGGRTKG